MDFNEVANIFEQIEKTNSRNEITSILADFYKELNKEEGQIIAYMILGRVAPFFLDSEFNYPISVLTPYALSNSSLTLLLPDITKEKTSSNVL